jgi:cytochrome P450
MPGESQVLMYSAVLGDLAGLAVPDRHVATATVSNHKKTAMTTVPEIELRDPRFDADKYGFIEELRGQNYYARTGAGDVVFLNQEDVREVLLCRDFRFAFDGIDESRSPYLSNAIQHELLNMHGARHARLSRLVKRALRDRIIDNLQEQITAIVDDLIADISAGEAFDFCADFADPLPARILGPMFGVPYDRVEGFNEWIRIGGRKLDALQTGVDIDIVEDANRKMHDYLRALLAERRCQPGEDLFSELLQVEIDGDRLTEDELVYLTTELASAGVDTTRTQLPLIVLALLQHPDELHKLQSDPKLALAAVDEGMRYAPLPWAIPHRAIRDFSYNTIEFKSGDLVFVLVPAANRDPAEMDEPQTFNITRRRARHFSFGAGMHACPGAHLARLEMATALEQLAAGDHVLALAGDIEWEPDQKDRGLKCLPMTRTLLE